MSRQLFLRHRATLLRDTVHTYTIAKITEYFTYHNQELDKYDSLQMHLVAHS